MDNVSKSCFSKSETLMSKIICETAENAKWEKFYWYKGWVSGQHLHRWWKTAQRSRITSTEARRRLLLKVLLLSTHSLFTVGFLAPSRSSLKQKGITEVPLSQPWAEAASQPHKRCNYRGTNLSSRTSLRPGQLLP